MQDYTQLGINNNHINIEEVKTLGFNRIEIGLGYDGAYEKRLNKALHDMAYAEANGIPYSIHLPIYMEDQALNNFLDAYYLDGDPIKRERSFLLLEDNLERLKASKAQYYVMHIHGVYLDPHMSKSDFESVIEESLLRIDHLAYSSGKKILLEYFGSTQLFSDYEEWTKRISKYEHLGLLMDTGHLYYASILHNFDFQKSFEHLAKHCDACHLWTTKGKAAYADNHYYKAYRHISANLNQRREDGWAFDTHEIIKALLASGKPIVLEASPLYKGSSYFYESAKALLTFAQTHHQEML